VKITFLGTGTSQGVPVIACGCPVCQSDDPRDKRLRTSVLIESGDVTFTIDAGPDFRQQMLRENVRKLDAILLTHAHKDHIAGMDDVRAFNYVSKDAIDIWGAPDVLREVRNEYAYVFAEVKYPGIPKMRLNEVNDQPFRINGLEVVPVPVIHMNSEILGFRIGSFAYITDASYISESSMAKLIGVKYLVINALRKQKHVSHFNLMEAVDHIGRISPRKAYLTHISHQMGFHGDVESELKPGILLAADGLSFTVD
jgi:phosphoribosyl 1,2-cyclic phosphate phosphodiesterase